MKRVIISNKIIKYRKEKGLTQKSFGELLGVSAQAISKWEREECYPDITLLPELSSIFGCGIGDLFE